ncbi:bifunctional DNA primase/polymerase [Novosphingobium beihaiensis]|uniref:Bifunctional DNA primase/polymerase n=1 Tax=Novosphingobium beihaiensis TaxID=2930389 RepID=A0ABT0BNN5_9SPHN|nr:bifunctional DNA primase/polymerase [Novosphingobium beihaiensis]MCJ2186667.1 bifunctional DNA primase/polymerase [Novosphingobium beihaiensis]
MKTDIFAHYAPEYWQALLPVMPLRENSKRPFLTEWQKYCSQMPSDDERAQWLRNYATCNIGLPLGPQSGLCMLDIDTDDEAVIDTIKALLPATPWERRGKKGMALAFRWDGEANFKIKGTAGSMLVELLGNGNQVVVPPSMHPDTGQPYAATCNLWEVMDQIPALPEGFEAKLRTELAAAGLTATTNDATGSKQAARLGVKINVTAEPGIERFLGLALQYACDEMAGATEGSRNTTLFSQSAYIARHVAAAGVDWTPFADALADVAIKKGLTEAETRSTVASGWKTGSPEPTEWIPKAAEYVYLAAQDRFYHPPSGVHLTQSGFSGMHGKVHGGRDTFASFVLDGGFVRKVQDITYDPRGPAGIVMRDNSDTYNTYRSSEISSVAGDPSPFLKFMEFLIPAQVERDHLLKVIAHTVRNPGDRVRHATILRTRNQGVGKSMLTSIWKGLVGESNFRQTSSREMQGNFEGWIKENTVLYCPELNIGTGLSTYNELKELITADDLVVNEKHLKPRRWNIYSTMIFTTNLAVPMLIEADDRRIFMIDSPAQPRPDGYYREFASWWQENLGVIRHFLDNVDLSDFNSHAPAPMTDAKRQLIRRSANPLVQDLAHIIAERKGLLCRDIVTIEEVVYELNGGRVSERTIANALKQLGGISLGQQRTAKGRKSLWVIRNQGLWLKFTSAARAQEFENAGGVFAGELPDAKGMDFEVALLSDLAGVDLEAFHASLGSTTLVLL